LCKSGGAAANQGRINLMMVGGEIVAPSLPDPPKAGAAATTARAADSAHAQAPRRALLSLLRPRQWLKNAVAMAPLMFALKLGDGRADQRTAVALLACCLLSSAACVINDILDRQADRSRPSKSAGGLRPGAHRPDDVDRRGEGGDPSALLLADAPLRMAVMLWLAADIALLYR
jgi:hypothetical protein